MRAVGLVAVLSFVFGCYAGHQASSRFGVESESGALPPQQVMIEKPVYVYVDRIVKVPEVIEVEKVVTQVVEKKIEVPKVMEITKTVYPERFSSAELAKEWVLNHRLPIVIIADEEGIIRLDRITSDSRYDCDDYADDYEKLALSANISLWQAPVTNGKIWGVQVTENTRGYHVGMWTKIDGIYYYIEPGPAKDEWRFVKIAAAD